MFVCCLRVHIVEPFAEKNTYPLPEIYRHAFRGEARLTANWIHHLNPSPSAKPVMTKLQMLSINIGTLSDDTKI